jgi:hypothetical protein
MFWHHEVCTGSSWPKGPAFTIIAAELALLYSFNSIPLGELVSNKEKKVSLYVTIWSWAQTGLKTNDNMSQSKGWLQCSHVLIQIGLCSAQKFQMQCRLYVKELKYLKYTIQLNPKSWCYPWVKFGSSSWIWNHLATHVQINRQGLIYYTELCSSY